MKKTNLVIAALFGSAAFVCFVFVFTAWAGLTDTQKVELGKCNHTYDQCVKGCPDQLSQGHNQVSQCQQACLNTYYDCRQKARIPGYVRGPGGSMGEISPPPKSHPTPTPRKGPGKIFSGPTTPPMKANPATPTPVPTLSIPPHSPHPSPSFVPLDRPRP